MGKDNNSMRGTVVVSALCTVVVSPLSTGRIA